jgi:uncharacterized SAM-binding protein YcdF (DUF218 family)
MQTIQPIRKKSLARNKVALLLLAIAAGLGWLVFRPPERGLVWLARYLIVSEQPQKSDLIVVLGGDFWGPRVLRAADLGMQGYANRVLISGPRYGSAYEGDYAIGFLERKGYPRQLFVTYPISAVSTIAEAHSLQKAFERYRARDILIVTSDYHTRRASIIFRALVPGYHYRFIAAQDIHLHPESWWTNAEGRQFFYSEWSKIIGTLLQVSWLGRW